MTVIAAFSLFFCFATTAQAGSSSCDIGQYWYRVAGELSSVSSGDAGVWGVSSAGDVLYRTGTYIGSSYSSSSDGRNYGYSHTDGSTWQQVDGRLMQLDVGKNTVWGVNSANEIHYRAGITSSTPTGTGWVRIPDGLARQVSVSDVDGKVWIVGMSNLVFRRVGISAELPGGSAWEAVLGISSVRYVDVGGAGVWATTTDGAVYYRVGSRQDCQGSSWQLVPGNLSQVASGGDAVWGLQSSGAVYYRFNVTAAKPAGSEWIQVSGILKQLSVSSSNNSMWGVNNFGEIYNRRQ